MNVLTLSAHKLETLFYTRLDIQDVQQTVSGWIEVPTSEMQYVILFMVQLLAFSASSKVVQNVSSTKRNETSGTKDTFYTDCLYSNAKGTSKWDFLSNNFK